MSKTNKHTWLSVHLFYNEPWEEFLYEAVEPYVSTAIQTGIAESYFFIRYWEKGPHIRLRFKGEKDMMETILKPNMEEHFLNYFESKPSIRVEPNFPKDFDEELKWHPNNTFTYFDYEGELERFGGENGISIIENQFMLSSKTILELIKRKTKSWSYDDALGNAIKLHLTFLNSMGMDINHAIQFLQFFTDNWLPYTYQKKEEQLEQDEKILKVRDSIASFENSFKAQKESLLPFHKLIWNTLENDDEFDDELLNSWVRENQTFSKTLNEVFDIGNLSKRSAKYIYTIAPKNDSVNVLLWSIFADLIHLTNNRLGIGNRDESYLTFMMQKCLEEIKKKKAMMVRDER